MSEPTKDQPTMAEILHRIREQYAADPRCGGRRPKAVAANRALHEHMIEYGESGLEMKWSYKEQRRMLEMAASSKSLEDLAERVGRPIESVRKMAPQLGISLKFNYASRRSASEPKTKSKA